MQVCPQCNKPFEPRSMSGDFCPSCADAIRDEFGFAASIQRAWIQLKEIVRRALSRIDGMSQPTRSSSSIAASFIFHQAIGTWGVAVVVPFLVAFGFDFLRIFGRSFTMRDTYWITTETGYFPCQIVFALFLGWLLGRDFRRGAMLWTWVLPFLILCYAVAMVPSIVPSLTPVVFQAGVGQSRLWHYFGPGCKPERRCLDQIVATMPFYAATAYSVGAFLAVKVPKHLRPSNLIRFWMSLAIGLVLLTGSAAMVIKARNPQNQSLIRQSIPEGIGELRWIMLAYLLVPVLAGAALILFADRIRRRTTSVAVDGA